MHRKVTPDPAEYEKALIQANPFPYKKPERRAGSVSLNRPVGRPSSNTAGHTPGNPPQGAPTLKARSARKSAARPAATLNLLPGIIFCGSRSEPNRIGADTGDGPVGCALK